MTLRSTVVVAAVITVVFVVAGKDITLDGGRVYAKVSNMGGVLTIARSQDIEADDRKVTVTLLEILEVTSDGEFTASEPANLSEETYNMVGPINGTTNDMAMQYMILVVPMKNPPIVISLYYFAFRQAGEWEIDGEMHPIAVGDIKLTIKINGETVNADPGSVFQLKFQVKGINDKPTVKEIKTTKEIGYNVGDNSYIRFSKKMLEFFRKFLEFFWKVEQTEPSVDIFAITVVVLLVAITILQCFNAMSFYHEYQSKLKKFNKRQFNTRQLSPILENDVNDERRVESAAVHETSVGIDTYKATVLRTSTRDRASKIPRLRSLLQAHNTSWSTPSSSCTVTGRNPFMSDQTIYY